METAGAPLERMGVLDATPKPGAEVHSGGAAAAGGKLRPSSSKIYDRHRRVWLGTFAAEPDAVADLRQLDDVHGTHTPSTAAARSHLFDKTLTPSDVGKLNRLVIPKQHAERNLPLPAVFAGGGGESKRQQLLLNLEDGAGKAWRFRYSYWSSSRSYVLTKGWIRFVREKGLHAGDVVGFRRSAAGKLFIDCNRPNSTITNNAHSIITDAVDQPAAVAKVVRLFGVDILAGAGREASKKKQRTRGADADVMQKMLTSD